jgi:hypothetical protein
MVDLSTEAAPTPTLSATAAPMAAERPAGDLAGSPPTQILETTADAKSDVRVNHVEDDSQHHARRHWGRHARFIFGFRF